VNIFFFVLFRVVSVFRGSFLCSNLIPKIQTTKHTNHTKQHEEENVHAQVLRD